MTDFLDSTRASYDTIARDYSARFADWSTDLPLERALLTAFAELVKAGGKAPVADVGSGPGGLTARLHDLGLPVFGVDVSPRMVELAREAHPGLRFHVGSMTALDLPAGTLGGITALYSTIHVPDEHLPAVFAEFHRVLVPGGHVLLAFQTGDAPEHLHLAERFGHGIALDYWFRPPEPVAGLLTAAGLAVRARVVREPVAEETRARAFLLARKEG
ncbi:MULTISPECIES: class I SAM-dependent methyltransferase [unclassified Streptomyces]|uniref:class I SAM-dependent DNA methyltransferase n=1 Tax=unclassified Streptomyces TaxID=2593676 RepID=UPI001F03FA06|nr:MULTISPECIES: class I SAM-dependent methyltransferase [unclassified Streptomyces]MCH0563888.1 class I SAM-dependent methyltransferase [Streptomyces sp. MUM 2J]MCH0571443.1 class I SAM-dependent methyltransferase [Streptomyces sp. MUM 136J]